MHIILRRTQILSGVKTARDASGDVLMSICQLGGRACLAQSQEAHILLIFQRLSDTLSQASVCPLQ